MITMRIIGLTLTFFRSLLANKASPKTISNPKIAIRNFMYSASTKVNFNDRALIVGYPQKFYANVFYLIHITLLVRTSSNLYIILIFFQVRLFSIFFKMEIYRNANSPNIKKRLLYIRNPLFTCFETYHKH